MVILVFDLFSPLNQAKLLFKTDLVIKAEQGVGRVF